jgi:hypothetical protein
MAKKKISRKQYIGMIVFVLLAIVAIFATTAFLITRGSYAPAATSKPGDVTITGTILCLPHKDTSGPQTMECAYGLKDEAGNYYGLGDSDTGYKNISNAPMNTQVKVSGTLKKETSTVYPTIGTIEVTRIDR